MSPLDRELAFGKESVPASGYLWCLHCERVYPYGAYRREVLRVDKRMPRGLRKMFEQAGMVDVAVKGIENCELQMCPYEDCDGDSVLDGMEWEWVRKYHPEYPEVPEYGCVYSL
jgi:hypothetical protein